MDNLSPCKYTVIIPQSLQKVKRTIPSSVGPSSLPVEPNEAEAHQLLPAMRGFDVADGPRLGAHDHAARMSASAKELDPAQKLTIGHARGRKEDIVALDQVINGQHLL